MVFFLDVKKNCFYIMFYVHVKLFLILREDYIMSFRTEWQGEYLEVFMVSTM